VTVRQDTRQDDLSNAFVAPKLPRTWPQKRQFVSVLADHALVEIRCDHDAKTDTPVCNCAVAALGAHPSVQAAKEAWALHVYDVLTRPA
jgi:hypothetical protein